MPAQRLHNLDSLAPLLQRPLGVFSDIDGTLAPIVSEPEEARVLPACREALERLRGLGVAVALVTGRPLTKAHEMVGLPGAMYAANHGLEIEIEGRLEAADDLGRYTAQARALLRELGTLSDPGVTVEDKGPVITFHYRRAEDQEAAHQEILESIDRLAATREFQVWEGRKVIELRPRIPADKGTAVRFLARTLGLHAAIGLGDDLTDVDMFRSIGELRVSGVPGATFAVRSEEAAPELLAQADYFVDGVPGVAWFLDALVDAISERATSGL